MKPENYLNVVEKLNSELEEHDYFFNEGLCFDYMSNNYVDIINFMDFAVFNSEMDSADSEEELEILIREQMLIYTNALCKWQKYDGF